MARRDLFIPHDAGGDPAALSAALLAGELAVFAGLESFAALSERARGIVEAQFGEDPPRAETYMSAEAFRNAAATARRLVREDGEIDRLWRATLAEIGYPPAEMRHDRMRLRVVPGSATARSRMIRPLPAHRDSWGSGIMAQINWWAPLWPLSPGATMHIWPEAFDRPVANTAGEWDYAALMSGADKTYPLLPEATEAAPGASVPVLIAPYELLGFAAAHLHASISEEGSPARFGLDTRTVWMGDVAAGRGAPNVDGGELTPRWEMFERGASAAAAPRQEEQGASR